MRKIRVSDVKSFLNLLKKKSDELETGILSSETFLIAGSKPENLIQLNNTTVLKGMHLIEL